MKPISVQLYSLREEAKEDFVGVLKRLAAIGYKGVEPAGFHDLEPAEFKKIVEDLGMVISSTHSPWARPNSLDETIELMGVLGIDMCAAGYGPDQFKDLDAIKATADELNMMNAKLAPAGITMTMHNHDFEFQKIDGRLKYDILAELAPDINFELDTYWASNFGANDVPAIVTKYGNRCPLLHIKDGSFVKGEPLLSVGAGKMDIPAVVAAASDVTKWLVVEQDNSATDMFECIEASYNYMISNGLAAGNK